MTLVEEIRELLKPELCSSLEVYNAFLKRLTQEGLTTDENATDHFTIYFQPYDPTTKQIFLTHHKKSGLWISPGGHIDKGESLLSTLNREISEELGLRHNFTTFPQPFLFTVTNIDNFPQICKIHYDIWILLETDGQDFQVDLKEFYTTGWSSFNQAKQKIIDPANLLALAAIEKLNYASN